jgi:hypothetical protein
MSEKLKKAVLMGTLIAGLAFTVPAFAQKVALNDLQNRNVEKAVTVKQNAIMDKDHWAYKTLQNISQKYGLTGAGKVFEGNAPITRSEAAIIFVNLVGQVQDKNIKMTEAEKAKVEVLHEELSNEIQQLSGRVSHLESGMTALEGRVTAVEDRDKKLWGATYGEDLKINGGMQAMYYGNLKAGNPQAPSNFSLPYGELQFSGKLAEHVKFMAVTVPTRNFHFSAHGLVDGLYISTDIIPHHEVQVGQVWVPFGMEAPMKAFDIDFIEYSQISRNLGRGVDTGSHIIGDWGFVNYTAGVYNGEGQNIKDSNQHMAYAGQVNLKPFYKAPQLGDLTIGASNLSGKNAITNYDGFGTHVAYKKGKFGAKFEYMDIDGLNGTNEQEGKGSYYDLMYQLTPKLTLLTRYDQYNPDLRVGGIATGEYIAGANYALTDNVLLMLNYTYTDRHSTEEADSSKLGFLTQVRF